MIVSLILAVGIFFLMFSFGINRQEELEIGAY